jgi:hypothetical protein
MRHSAQPAKVVDNNKGEVMILGMSAETFTLLHVLISLVGIGSGFFVVLGFLSGRRLNGCTALFLATTVLTSVTGFGFPFSHLLPSHIIGIISLVILAIAIPARYLFQLSGVWRGVYVIGSTLALYFNVFVLVVQAFRRVPALKAVAPTQTEPPFLVAQLFFLLIFVTLAILAMLRFHPERIHLAESL